MLLEPHRLRMPEWITRVEYFPTVDSTNDAARRLTASLSGSTAAANFRFAAVYSWPKYTRVSGGSAASRVSDSCIIGASPSNSRPHPPPNSVSPVNTASPTT